MRFLIVSTFLSFASFIQGQSVDDLAAQLPSCSLPCLEKVSKAGGCAVKDYACLCGLNGNYSLRILLTECLLKACAPSDRISKISPFLVI